MTSPIDFSFSLLTQFYDLLHSPCTLPLSELCAFSVHCVHTVPNVPACVLWICLRCITFTVTFSWLYTRSDWHCCAKRICPSVFSDAGRRCKTNCSSSSLIVTSIPGWWGQVGGNKGMWWVGGRETAAVRKTVRLVKEHNNRNTLEGSALSPASAPDCSLNTGRAESKALSQWESGRVTVWMAK